MKVSEFKKTRTIKSDNYDIRQERLKTCIIGPIEWLDDDLEIEYHFRYDGQEIIIVKNSNTLEQIEKLFGEVVISCEREYKLLEKYKNELERTIEKCPTMDVKSFKYIVDRLGDL